MHYEQNWKTILRQVIDLLYVARLRHEFSIDYYHEHFLCNLTSITFSNSCTPNVL